MNSLAYNPAYVAEPAVVAQCGGAQDALSFIGEVIINGVSIPFTVLEQLRQAGVSAVGWLSGAELQDAVQACKYDGTLIDDHGGMNFRDKLSLTSAEQAARRPQRKKNQTYAEMIRDEREGKSREYEEDPGILAM